MYGILKQKILTKKNKSYGNKIKFSTNDSGEMQITTH